MASYTDKETGNKIIGEFMKNIKTGMTFEEFLTFQNETGLTDDKIKTITAAEMKEAIDKYQKQK